MNMYFTGNHMDQPHDLFVLNKKLNVMQAKTYLLEEEAKISLFLLSSI